MILLVLVFALMLSLLVKPGLKNGNKRIKILTITKVPYIVTKVPYMLQKCPIVTKCPIESYESTPLTLQKCPRLQKFPTMVTKVPIGFQKFPVLVTKVPVLMALSLSSAKLRVQIKT